MIAGFLMSRASLGDSSVRATHWDSRTGRNLTIPKALDYLRTSLARPLDNSASGGPETLPNAGGSAGQRIDFNARFNAR